MFLRLLLLESAARQGGLGEGSRSGIPGELTAREKSQSAPKTIPMGFMTPQYFVMYSWMTILDNEESFVK